MSEFNLVPRHETEHPRRAFLTGAAAAGAAALLVGSGRAFAAPEKEPAHTHSWVYGGVTQAATTCMGAGHECLSHCLNSLGLWRAASVPYHITRGSARLERL